MTPVLLAPSCTQPARHACKSPLHPCCTATRPRRRLVGSRRPVASSHAADHQAVQSATRGERRRPPTPMPRSAASSPASTSLEPRATQYRASGASPSCGWAVRRWRSSPTRRARAAPSTTPTSCPTRRAAATGALASTWANGTTTSSAARARTSWPMAIATWARGPTASALWVKRDGKLRKQYAGQWLNRGPLPLLRHWCQIDRHRCSAVWLARGTRVNSFDTGVGKWCETLVSRIYAPVHLQNSLTCVPISLTPVHAHNTGCDTTWAVTGSFSWVIYTGVNFLNTGE